MQKNIHPPYQELKIKVGKDMFITKSTLTTGEILMDIDYREHPAWNKNATTTLKSNKNISNFNRKFGTIFNEIK